MAVVLSLLSVYLSDPQVMHMVGRTPGCAAEAQQLPSGDASKPVAAVPERMQAKSVLRPMQKSALAAKATASRALGQQPCRLGGLRPVTYHAGILPIWPRSARIDATALCVFPDPEVPVQ